MKTEQLLFIIIIFLSACIIFRLFCKNEIPQIPLNIIPIKKIQIISPKNNVQLTDFENINLVSDTPGDWVSDIQGVLAKNTNNVNIDLIPGIHKIKVISSTLSSDVLTVKKTPYMYDNESAIGSNIYCMIAGYVFDNNVKKEFTIVISQLGSRQQSFNSRYVDKLNIIIGDTYYETSNYSRLNYQININNNMLYFTSNEMKIKNILTEQYINISFNFVLNKGEFDTTKIDDILFRLTSNKNDGLWKSFPLKNCSFANININNKDLRVDLSSVFGQYERNFVNNPKTYANFNMTFNIADIQNKTLYFAILTYPKRSQGSSIKIDLNEINIAVNIIAVVGIDKPALKVNLYPSKYGIQEKVVFATQKINFYDNTHYLSNFSEFYISFIDKYLVGITECNYLYDTGNFVNSDVKVTIVTGIGSFAGTNNDVYITFLNGKSYLLDKEKYDDFESNDSDTYLIKDPNLTKGDLSKFEIKLKPSLIYDDWYLREIAIYYKNKLISWNKPLVWLNSKNPIWKNY